MSATQVGQWPAAGRRKGRATRRAGWTLIALGAVILEFAAYELFGTALVAKGHQRELRKEFQALVSNPVVASPAPVASPVRSPAPRPRAKAIALLTIPKIGVEQYVVDGVRLRDLAHGPGRYPSTAKIGAAGSTGIAGHRTGWGSPFLNLDKLRPGDLIRIETIDAKFFEYRVTRSIVVGPEALWVLKGNPDSRATHQLTLTTCTPKYTSRNRLIIWADLVPGGTA